MLPTTEEERDVEYEEDEHDEDEDEDVDGHLLDSTGTGGVSDDSL